MGEGSLSGWMKALIAYVRSGEPDLTNRQMALLMLVYLTPGPHTVRGLARLLGVSKPVVTRALNTLGALGYLRRERDQDDRRNVFVVRTNNGADFLEGFCSAALTGTFDDRPSGHGQFIADWVRMLDRARDKVRARHTELDRQAFLDMEREAVKVSLANLRTFPWIREREKQGSLKLHGAHFSIAEGRLYMLDEAENSFRPV